MELTFVDRFKAVVRMIKIAFNPSVSHISVFWVEEEPSKNNGRILTHTFYKEGDDPVDPFLTYMAHVASKSDNIDELNRRAEFFLNKTAVGYTLIKKLQGGELRYIQNPIRLVELEAENIEVENK